MSVGKDFSSETYGLSALTVEMRVLSPVVVAAEVATEVNGSWSRQFLMLTKRSKCVKKNRPLYTGTLIPLAT